MFKFLGIAPAIAFLIFTVAVLGFKEFIWGSMYFIVPFILIGIVYLIEKNKQLKEDLDNERKK